MGSLDTPEEWLRGYICEVCTYQRYGKTPLYAVNICLGCIREIATESKYEHHYCRERAISFFIKGKITHV